MRGQFAYEDMAQIAKALTVQQLQLKIRNAALVDAIKDATKQDDRVRDLYELAPFGHLTLDKKGHITQLNHLSLAIIDETRVRTTIDNVAKHLLFG